MYMSYRRRDWTVRGSNPGGSEIFRICPYRLWGPPSLLYNEYRVFPGGKELPGCHTDLSPPSSAIGLERVELYLYSPLWTVRLVQSFSVCTGVHFTHTHTHTHTHIYIYIFIYLLIVSSHTSLKTALENTPIYKCLVFLNWIYII